jgi:hypothetical protein
MVLHKSGIACKVEDVLSSSISHAVPIQMPQAACPEIVPASKAGERGSKRQILRRY